MDLLMFASLEVLALVILGIFLNRQWKRERPRINEVRGGPIRIRIKIEHPPR